ncbi:MAG: hypothetical protein KAI47_13180 [Deltaproteobacteria bacterium]|nr:hypothetical protein [Deltaproteobacteria bacterium]
MRALLRITTFALPVALVGAAVALEFAKGSLHPVPLAIASLAALALGITLVFFLRALALLGGDLSPEAATRHARIRALEADLGGLERTLSGISLDAEMGRVEAAEADELAASLRAHAEVVREELSCLREIDVEGVDAEIEREVQRRLRQRAGGKA